jgi:hypothetical protein
MKQFRIPYETVLQHCMAYLLLLIFKISLFYMLKFN